MLSSTAAFGPKRLGRPAPTRRELAPAEAVQDWCTRPQAGCFRAQRPSGRAARTAGANGSGGLPLPSRCWLTHSARQGASGHCDLRVEVARTAGASDRRGSPLQSQRLAAAPGHRQGAFEPNGPRVAKLERSARLVAGVRSSGRQHGQLHRATGRAPSSTVALVVATPGGTRNRQWRFASAVNRARLVCPVTAERFRGRSPSWWLSSAACADGFGGSPPKARSTWLVALCRGHRLRPAGSASPATPGLVLGCVGAGRESNAVGACFQCRAIEACRGACRRMPLRPCAAWSPDPSDLGPRGTGGTTPAASGACSRHER